VAMVENGAQDLEEHPAEQWSGGATTRPAARGQL
jgi:hypothetical protein